MSLLSFKTTFDTFSFYPSRRLSHDPAVKPNNTNRKGKPKLKAKPYNAYNSDSQFTSANDPKYNGPSPFLNYKINNWLQFSSL